jgi:hypothetical protein
MAVRTEKRFTEQCITRGTAAFIRAELVLQIHSALTSLPSEPTGKTRIS